MLDVDALKKFDLLLSKRTANVCQSLEPPRPLQAGQRDHGSDNLVEEKVVPCLGCPARVQDLSGRGDERHVRCS